MRPGSRRSSAASKAGRFLPVEAETHRDTHGFGQLPLKVQAGSMFFSML